MNHLRLVRNDEAEPIKCECSECGTTWARGAMGDNETLCFRCEHTLTTEDQDEDYGHDLDDDECEELDQ